MAKKDLLTKRRTLAQILICVGCCCGQVNRGHPEVPVDWLKKSWKERKLAQSIQLTISGCLGPCDLTNVACLMTPVEAFWFGNLTNQSDYSQLLDWATKSANAQKLLPIPKELTKYLFNRFSQDNLNYQAIA